MNKANTQAWIAAGGAVFGVIAQLISTSRFGLAVSADSANYLSVAESFYNGNGFVQFDDFKFYNTPPLYPLLLSLAFVLHIPILVFAKLLNLLAYIAAQYFCWRIIRNYFEGAFRGAVALLVAAAYWPFTLAFTWCLSEGVFIALFCGLQYHLLVQPETKKHRMMVALFIALMCMQRYAGLMMLPGLVAYWLIRREKWKHMLLQLAPALLLMGLWFARNLAVSGMLLGDHHPGDKFSLAAVVDNTMRIGWLAYVPLAVLAFMIFMLFARSQKSGSADPITLLLTLASTSYLVLLIVQPGLKPAQWPRYLTVIWIPLTLIVARWIIEFGERGVKANRLAFMALMGGIIFQLIFGFDKAFKAQSEGAGGYSTEYWQSKTVAGYLRNKVPAGTLMSNYPDFVWLTTHRKCRYTQFNQDQTAPYITKNTTVDYCIWFNRPDRVSQMKPLEDIMAKHHLQRAAGNTEMSIWKVGG